MNKEGRAPFIQINTFFLPTGFRAPKHSNGKSICSRHKLSTNDILPETNIFAPENGCLEYNRFLMGPGLFSGSKKLLVSYIGYLFLSVCPIALLQCEQTQKGQVSETIFVTTARMVMSSFPFRHLFCIPLC